MDNTPQKNKAFSQILRRKRVKGTKPTNSSWLKRILFWMGSLVVIVGIVGGVFLITILSQLPDLPTTFDNAESTIIYDREGNTLYTIHGEENRKEIPLSEIPKHVVDATIAIEDDQFFDHYGFDIGGIIKAFLAEYVGIGNPRGGSTITQQLVKNTLLTNERTVTRKLKELILSIQIERTYSKNEILSLYLNTIPYGSNAYGIEMASLIYFGKNTKDLSLAEASILASLPQAPSRYNPYGNGKDLLLGYFNEEGDYVAGRKDVVLRRMLDLGFIDDEERQGAFDEAAQITFQRYRENIVHPHLVLYVKELLESKFGKDAVETGGLRVYTTIDPELQQLAEATIAEKMESYPERYGATNASALTVDLEQGHILAMVGSADYFNEEIDGNVNVVFRNRLPGSSFKPFVFATGFAKGFSPATVFYDLETDFGNNYIPQNYDGSFSGPVSARNSLARSLNIPSVKMAFLAGPENVVTQAKKMGLTDLIDGDQYGTSIGLGTGESTLYQMVTAYSVLANSGQKMAFTPILRIETSTGKVIESNEDREPKTTEVLDPQIAYSINHILSDKTARPAGWNSTLQLPNQINGAKTGTSNKRLREGNEPGAIKPLDNWTIGYTTKFVTGVWVGNNDAEPMNFNAAGLTTAGPIWREIMLKATEDQDLEEFPRPDGVTWKQVSRRSGLLPSANTPEEDVVAELFTTFNLPTEVDQTFRTVEIDKVSKKLPTENTPEDAIVEALVANFHSLNPTDPNWEGPVQKWAEGFLEEYASDKIILSSIPTEYDDVHNNASARRTPEIEIVSPNNGSTIPMGVLEVQVKIDAPHGVEKVDYFVNQRLTETVSTFPYTAKLRIPRRYLNNELRIGATVTDLLYYEDSTVINVEVGETSDEEPPTVSITYPEENALFPPRTSLSIQTNAVDNVSVDEVTFFLDDRIMGTVSNAPYELPIELPNEVAPHTITVIAKDSAGNTSRDDVNITIEDEERRRVSTTFVYPKANSSFSRTNGAIDFFFTVSAIDQRKEELQVIATNTDSETSIIIYTAPEQISQNTAFSWVPDAPGDYEISLEVSDEEGSETMSSLEISIE